MKTIKNLKTEILNDLKLEIEAAKEIIIDAVLTKDNELKETFTAEYLKVQKMYDILLDTDYNKFNVEVTE